MATMPKSAEQMMLDNRKVAIELIKAYGKQKPGKSGCESLGDRTSAPLDAVCTEKILWSDPWWTADTLNNEELGEALKSLNDNIQLMPRDFMYAHMMRVCLITAHAYMYACACMGA